MSDSLWTHGLQQARTPCPEPTPELTQTHIHRVGDALQTFILSNPLLLPPSIFANIRVFSNESALQIRWPKYWSFSFSISPFNDWWKSLYTSLFIVVLLLTLSVNSINNLINNTLNRIHVGQLQNSEWATGNFRWLARTQCLRGPVDSDPALMSISQPFWWNLMEEKHLKRPFCQNYCLVIGERLTKLESKHIIREIWITSDTQMTPPLWQKV